MTEIDVPDWVVKAAEDARVHRLNAVTAYGSAGVDERYHMAMRAALTAALGAWVVPDGWKLVPVEPTEVMCEAAMSSLGWTRSEAAAKTAPITPASPMMEGSMKVWSAMLATAPAASGVDTSTNEAWAARAQEKIAAMEAATGGEDDMCPNCVTPWKCNGPHESTGGASVSERARELLAQQYMGSKFAHLNAIGLCIRDGSIADDTAISFALRAIEQALTQQRATTPQPSADAVRELVLLSRGLAKRTFNRSTAEMYIHFADELESLLSAASGEKGVG